MVSGVNAFEKQSLSCPSVNFAPVVDQTILQCEAQALCRPYQILFVAILVKYNCHDSLLLWILIIFRLQLLLEQSLPTTAPCL
jgi:hypothetical protein